MDEIVRIVGELGEHRAKLESIEKGLGKLLENSEKTVIFQAQLPGTINEKIWDALEDHKKEVLAAIEDHKKNCPAATPKTKQGEDKPKDELVPWINFGAIGKVVFAAGLGFAMFLAGMFSYFGSIFSDKSKESEKPKIAITAPKEGNP